MSLKTLAEAILLQAAEDFLGDDRQEEDVVFFGGDGFRLCAEMAGLGHEQKCTFLEQIRKSAPARHPEEMKTAVTGSQRVLHI